MAVVARYMILNHIEALHCKQAIFAKSDQLSFVTLAVFEEVGIHPQYLIKRMLAFDHPHASPCLYNSPIADGNIRGNVIFVEHNSAIDDVRTVQVPLDDDCLIHEYISLNNCSFVFD